MSYVEQQSVSSWSNQAHPSHSTDRQESPSWAWVLRWKWYLVAWTLVWLAAGVVYLIQAAPIYVVGARLLVQVDPLSLSKELPVRADPKLVATQAEILRSPEIVRRALDSPKLAGVTEWQANSEITRAKQIENLVKSLNVVPVGTTSVLQLSLRCPNPETFSPLIDAVIDSYAEFMREMQRGNYSESLKLLTEQEATLRADLDTLESEFREMRAESRLIGKGQEAFSVHLSLLQKLGERLSEATSMRIDLESQLHAVTHGDENTAPVSYMETSLSRPDTGDFSNRSASASPAALNRQAQNQDDQDEVHEHYVPGTLSPAMRNTGGIAVTDQARVQQELWQAEIRATELAGTYGPDHPQMRAIQQQIAMWRRVLQEAEQLQPVVLVKALRSARQTEVHLSEQYERAFQQVKALDQAQLREQQALEKINRVQSIRDSTLKQLQELKLTSQALAEGRPIITVRKLDGPNLVANRVWPKPVQIAGIAMVLGLITGSAHGMFVQRKRK